MSARLASHLRQVASRAFIIVLPCLVAAPAGAQSGATVRVTRATAVLENPRGDSVVVGAVDRGVVLPVLAVRGTWYQVGPPEGATWKQGWIQSGFVELASPGAGGSRPLARSMEGQPVRQRQRGPTMVRGFAQASGTLFAARDSFETILGSMFGAAYGVGAQVVLPSGMFVQGGVDRFRKTGTSAIVSGEQVFRIETPDTVTVTPIQFTLGYRATQPGRIIGYLGAGAGWHLFEEETPAVLGTETFRDGHIGYHVGGGAEYKIGPGVWLAGEIQFTAVPNALGESGISSVFGEKNLGGTTFRVKIVVGN